MEFQTKPLTLNILYSSGIFHSPVGLPGLSHTPGLGTLKGPRHPPASGSVQFCVPPGTCHTLSSEEDKKHKILDQKLNWIKIY